MSGNRELGETVLCHLLFQLITVLCSDPQAQTGCAGVDATGGQGAISRRHVDDASYVVRQQQIFEHLLG